MYEWQGKEVECYQLYVEERRSLAEVMTYFKEKHDFGPSKRAWQTQIRKWAFPTKLHPAWQNETLVTRVRQLWEQSMPAKQMLATLQQEGFDVKERDLMRLRTKHKLFLRGNDISVLPLDDPGALSDQPHTAPVSTFSGASNLESVETHPGLKKRKRGEQQSVSIEEDAEHQKLHSQFLNSDAPNSGHNSSSAELDPDIKQRRQERLAQLAVESEEHWALKKRRRRTRGWAGLPADPPQAPRFRSETTIDESKAYLSLDNDQWATIRTQFTAICREAGVKKKTAAGAERWQAVKDRLVQENTHLHNEFLGPATKHTREDKSLGLDVLCLDIVKRLRSLDTRMTLGEARHSLGLNPAQAEQARENFRAILRADQFVSKLATGESRWRELQQKWIQSQPILQANLLIPLPTPHTVPQDPSLQIKLKAMEILSTDIMKRLREEQSRADPDPSRTKYSDTIHNGPGPGPAKANPPGGKHTRRQEPHNLLPVPVSMSANQQHIQALVQPLVDSQVHQQPHNSHYQSAVPSALSSTLSTTENRLRQSLHQHSSLEHQGISSQQSGQIDPFLLAVANSNEWSADQLVPTDTVEGAAQRLQAYAASASRDE